MLKKWPKFVIVLLFINLGNSSIILTLNFNFTSSVNPVFFSISDVTVIVDQIEQFIVHQISPLHRNITLSFEVSHKGHIDLDQTQIQLNAIGNQTISFRGLKSGGLVLNGVSNPKGVISDDDLFIRIRVANSKPLIYISITIGWLYFVAWSIAGYPQIYLNFFRKSVIGLSFDYLAIGIVGNFMYLTFNSALYWIPTIQDEYYDRYPKGQIPVKINVFFSMHASALATIIIIQCFFYESGNQKVAKKTWCLLGIVGLVFLATLVLAALEFIEWLDFLYTCSYIKLGSTLVKYTPQLYLNFQRKSTVGRSIWSVLLDFTGGVLSILQMILISANYDDWVSIFGDPTKFWLGIVSIGFTCIFLFQHYVLYRKG